MTQVLVLAIKILSQISQIYKTKPKFNQMPQFILILLITQFRLYRKNHGLKNSMCGQPI